MTAFGIPSLAKRASALLGTEAFHVALCSARAGDIKRLCACFEAFGRVRFDRISQLRQETVRTDSRRRFDQFPVAWSCRMQGTVARRSRRVPKPSNFTGNIYAPPLPVFVRRRWRSVVVASRHVRSAHLRPGGRARVFSINNIATAILSIIRIHFDDVL